MWLVNRVRGRCLLIRRVLASGDVYCVGAYGVSTRVSAETLQANGYTVETDPPDWPAVPRILAAGVKIDRQAAEVRERFKSLHPDVDPTT